MYSIQKKDYGYKITFSGFLNILDIKNWKRESSMILNKKNGKFGVYVDMKDLNPLTENVQKEIIEGQKYYKNAGMQRSVVIVSDKNIANQFKKIAQISGIYEWERYICTKTNKKYKSKALDWIKQGKDPDKTQ